ncbi:MAG: alpha/beta fold hydrolase [Rhodospirillaceae bacterium]|jgi:pimeloyl-ACP methyl ester carboxylesterase|nr:alpha/beta fold hydrolase [Rhodospirillaceae bacterium]MBT5241398.1 alpha/beta fold hydrolase [Rhodospirillaceae bacterium]MBT5566590.1 alpha/beta fold hydrolase [Rhodospirillaceae bacterium]MBT6090679.1 alpha/beta fold hydrolase [Rhodospirillaceae bacterium]MBT6961810.1 alpha/beta fold hydrolase [Rhodospirillaceae bacterium]
MTEVNIWRHYANSRDGQVHVLSADPKDASTPRKTPLICLHQSPMSGDVFEEFLPVIAQDRLVHCPDTPGFGGSDRPRKVVMGEKANIENFGLGLADALIDLGYSEDNPVDLFGFHTGSLGAIELTRARPSLVRRIILVGIPYYPAEEREAMEKRFVTPYAFLTDPTYVPDMYARMVLNATNDLSNEERFEAFLGRMRAGPNGQDGPDSVWSYDADEGLAALAALKKPTLFLAFNEVLTEPHKHAHRLYFPDVPLIELSHLPMEGFKAGPQDVADAVLPFLDG